eukprot:1069657-Pyramimonas_sp.AAC.1
MVPPPSLLILSGYPSLVAYLPTTLSFSLALHAHPHPHYPQSSLHSSPHYLLAYERKQKMRPGGNIPAVCRASSASRT